MSVYQVTPDLTRSVICATIHTTKCLRGGERTLHFSGNGIQLVDSGREVGRQRRLQLARATDCVEECHGGRRRQPSPRSGDARESKTTRYAAPLAVNVVATTLLVSSRAKASTPTSVKDRGAFFFIQQSLGYAGRRRNMLLLLRF